MPISQASPGRLHGGMQLSAPLRVDDDFLAISSLIVLHKLRCRRCFVDRVLGELLGQLYLKYSVSAVFTGKTLNFFGREIDANCQGH
eukprot:719590-Pleurochrysis_carterae.AAC.1